jgi:tetratricopeptide (TPR) repeat protein
MAHFAMGRYEAAIEWADQSLAAQPDYRPALRIKAAALAYLGLVEAAQVWLGRTLELDPGLTIAQLKTLAPASQFQAHYIEGLRKAGLAEE